MLFYHNHSNRGSDGERHASFASHASGKYQNNKGIQASMLYKDFAGKT